VFSVTGSQDPVLLDKPGLTHMLPAEFRDTLRENDHVFVEASRVEEERLYLRVWGYGTRDPGGFRWHCQYGLRENVVSCEQASH